MLYLGGVGSRYNVDRVFGGALGFGLHSTLLTAYRFLALNFEPGDIVYVFGFSRGAFTARSLVGMIDRVGLAHAPGLFDGSLVTANDLYQRARENDNLLDEEIARFREEHCHKHVCVALVGVFDTVEALGPQARFHNVDFLRDAVASGRQALAIEEQRRIFWPHLWAGDPNLASTGRVQQVWFEGCHSDVGGGTRSLDVPNATLLWMVEEASRQGLRFNQELLVARI